MLNFELASWKTNLLLALGILGMWAKSGSLFSRLISAVVLLLLASTLWTALGPRRPELGEPQRNALESLITENVRAAVNVLPRGQSVALLHLQGDNSGFVTDSIRSRLDSFGTLPLFEPTFAEKFGAFLGLRPITYGDLDSAAARGAQLNASLVLFGHVDFQVSSSGQLQPELRLRLAHVATREETPLLATKSALDEASTALGGFFSDPTRREGSVTWKHLVQRLAIWLVLALMFPVITVGFLNSVLRRQSSTTNALTLATYTLISTLVCVLLIGFAPTTWWFWVILSMTTCASAVYYLAILSHLVQTNG